MSRDSTSPFSRWIVATAIAAAACVSGCDNPACVFGGNCSSDSASQTAPNAAALPANHQWIVAGAPRVSDFFPSGTMVSTQTPIVVVFSESMSTPAVQGAFVLMQDADPGAGGGFGGGFAVPVPTAAPTLVGDGRVLIVAPLMALTADRSYTLSVTEMATVTDLEGFALPLAADRVIGTFTVAVTDPTVPRVLTTFPPDGATNQSTTGELIVVFDRPMTSVNSNSFVVKVDGQTPMNNPLPQSALLIGSLGIPANDTRVWRYRSADNNNEAVPLATNAMVELTLSPSGNAITASGMGGGALPTQTIEYQTAPFGAPLSAEIVSTPTDAIGIANLDGTKPLEVGVQLVGAVGSDVLDMFVIGRSKDPMSGLALFVRNVRLSDLPTFDLAMQTVTIGEPQLDLVASGTPITPRFEEGDVTIALALRRGSASSPVRLLDVDKIALGVQNAIVDVTAPTLTGLGTSGTNTTAFRSDARDLIVVGRANERLRVAEVAASGMDNGMLADVVASEGSGLFIAQPVALGIVDPVLLPVPFDLKIYDRAMNPAVGTFHSDFTQLGTVADSSGIGSAQIEVEVFDARTLAAISGARVYLHADNGGTLVSHGFLTTATSGIAPPLNAAVTGLPIVTVEATGYDLFTFYDVRTNRISVPLTRSNAQPGKVQGTISTSSIDLPQFDRFVGDTRTFDSAEPEIVVQSCTFNPQNFTSQCGFGPQPLRLGILGGVGFVAVDPPLSAFTFTAQGFLRGYHLQLPLAPVSTGQSSTVNFSVDQLLDDPDTDPEERAIEGPVALLDASAANGLDLDNLDGAPRVEIQARVPGLSGAVLAGYGAALDPQGSPASAWAVRSAIAGVADPFDDDGAGANDAVGELVSDGTIEDELYLRCEARDDSGGRSGRRERFTQTPLTPLSITLPAVPTWNAPSSGSTTAGATYDIDFDDVIADGSGLSGLYRVALVSSSGRAWVLYRFDQTGTSQGNVELPDLASAGGTPLPSGPIVGTVSAFAWASFAAPLALTDVERQHELFASSAPVMFDQP